MNVLDHTDSEEPREIITWICEGLLGAPELRKVVLDSLPLYKCAFQLAPFLCNEQMLLHELSLADSGLSDGALQVLMPSLEKQAPSLRKFVLKLITLGEASFVVLGRLIGMMTDLEELDLAGLHHNNHEVVARGGWNLITEGLRSVTNHILESDGVVKLRSIDLTDASLGNGSDDGHPVHVLAKVLGKLPNLTILRVNNAGLEKGGFEKLATSMGNGGVNQLSELGVEGLGLGPNGARVVATFSMTQQSLQILNISHNSMAHFGNVFDDETRSLKDIAMDCSQLERGVAGCCAGYMLAEGAAAAMTSPAGA